MLTRNARRRYSWDTLLSAQFDGPYDDNRNSAPHHSSSFETATVTIEFSCTECQKLLRADDMAADTQVRCPICRTVLTVPNPQGQPAALAEIAEEELQINPYESPAASSTSDIAGLGMQSSGTPGDLRISSILGGAWDIFKRHWGHCTVAVLVICGIDVGAGLGSMLLERNLLRVLPVIWYAAPFIILYFCLQVALHLWLATGLIVFIARCIQGLPPDITYLFRAGPYFSRVLEAFLWRMLFIGLVVGPVELVLMLVHQGGFLFPGDGTSEGVLGLLISAIPAFLIFVRYSQTTYLVLDQNITGKESLRISRQMTKGRIYQLAFVHAVLWLIGVSGFFVCAVGLFATMAFSEIGWVVLYQRLAPTIAQPDAKVKHALG